MTDFWLHAAFHCTLTSFDAWCCLFVRMQRPTASVIGACKTATLLNQFMRHKETVYKSNWDLGWLLDTLTTVLLWQI